MSFICNICNMNFSTKQRLNTHNETEKHKSIFNIYSKFNDKYNKEITEIKEKNNIIQKENEKLKIQICNLIEENKEVNIQLNHIKNKSEEYRKIVEKASTKSNNNFKIKEDILNDNMFQIDINVNNKQLNKIKYKDVSEEIVKKDIQSLKLKDSYQLEYREEDGFINITNLCKAGGKEFKSWNRLDKTKRFLDVLSSSVKIHTNELIKYEPGSNSERSTWAHPQVAINIAQWISPEFDVLVSKWVYEIMLTGKVDVRDNKTTEELDIMNVENKLLKNRIKLLESKFLQKQPRETFEDNKNVVYIVTTEFKEAQGHYKIGKAQDLQKRLSVYNTSEKHKVIYNTSCKTKKNMDLLEQIVHNRLETKRVEPNKEWFESEEDAEDFVKVIEECKKIVDC
jgi:hypothetical protein